MKPVSRFLTFATVITFITVIALTSCGANTNTPKGTAEAFLGSLKTMDFKKAAEYGTDTAKQTLLFLDSMKGSIPKEEIEKSKTQKLEIGAVEETGDKATVKYKIGEDAEQVLDLVKEKDTWKVDFKKQM